MKESQTKIDDYKEKAEALLSDIIKTKKMPSHPLLKDHPIKNATRKSNSKKILTEILIKEIASKLKFGYSREQIIHTFSKIFNDSVDIVKFILEAYTDKKKKTENANKHSLNQNSKPSRDKYEKKAETLLSKITKMKGMLSHLSFEDYPIKNARRKARFLNLLKDILVMRIGIELQFKASKRAIIRKYEAIFFQSLDDTTAITKAYTYIRKQARNTNRHSLDQSADSSNVGIPPSNAKSAAPISKARKGAGKSSGKKKTRHAKYSNITISPSTAKSAAPISKARKGAGKSSGKKKTRHAKYSNITIFPSTAKSAAPISKMKKGAGKSTRSKPYL